MWRHWWRVFRNHGGRLSGNQKNIPNVDCPTARMYWPCQYEIFCRCRCRNRLPCQCHMLVPHAKATCRCQMPHATCQCHANDISYHAMPCHAISLTILQLAVTQISLAILPLAMPPISLAILPLAVPTSSSCHDTSCSPCSKVSGVCGCLPHVQ